MGLVVELQFENGIRTVEIDDQNNIEFLDYNISYDETMAALGGEESDEVRFYRLFSEDGLDVMMQRAWGRTKARFSQDDCIAWTLAFVKAIKEQGVEAFGSLTEYDIAWKIFKSDLSEDGGAFEEIVDSFASKETIAEWLIEWIKNAISGSNRYQSDSHKIAEILKNYLEDGDVDVSVEEILYCNDDHSYENTECWRFRVDIKEKEVASWNEELQYRIWDPVGLSGGIDYDRSDYDESNSDTREQAENVLSELGVEKPKIRDPEPPDHPETDPDGEFAVLYEFRAGYGDRDREYTNELVSYETRRQAEAAMEISEDMFKSDGNENYVDMTIMRRLTPDEKLARTQVDLFKKQVEHEEWEDEWTPLGDDD